jgi:hypothetical protein
MRFLTEPPIDSPFLMLVYAALFVGLSILLMICGMCLLSIFFDWLYDKTLPWVRFRVKTYFGEGIFHQVPEIIIRLVIIVTAPISITLLIVDRLCLIPDACSSHNLSRKMDLSSENLEILAKHWYRPTRHNVARHPNASEQVLVQLSGEFPRSVVANPVFALLQLVDPNLLDKMPERDLERALGDEQVPLIFIQTALPRLTPNLTHALLQNPQTPESILIYLLPVLDKFPHRALLLNHRHFTGQLQEQIAVSPDLPELKRLLLCKLLWQPSSRSMTLLTQIAKTGDAKIQVILLQDWRCPALLAKGILQKHHSPLTLSIKLRVLIAIDLLKYRSFRTVMSALFFHQNQLVTLWQHHFRIS